MKIGKLFAAALFVVLIDESASAATIDFNSAVLPGRVVPPSLTAPFL
jgi:hypothetical protein